jgi:hypothetical protein
MPRDVIVTKPEGKGFGLALQRHIVSKVPLLSRLFSVFSIRVWVVTVGGSEMCKEDEMRRAILEKEKRKKERTSG